jgi:glycerol uptake facilitator-like aquaporin
VLKPALAEFIFTFFLLLIGIMAGAGLDLNAAALSTGFTLYAFIVASFDISGGYLNPIISYGMFLCGGVALDVAVVYVTVQLAAAIAAAGVSKVSLTSILYKLVTRN